MKIELKSQFIVPGIDVNDGDVLKFADEGKEVVNKWGNTQYAFTFELQDGNKKIMSLNSTSLRNCIKAWGDDTKNWVGKFVDVSIEEIGEGKRKIILTPQNG